MNTAENLNRENIGNTAPDLLAELLASAPMAATIDMSLPAKEVGYDARAWHHTQCKHCDEILAYQKPPYPLQRGQELIIVCDYCDGESKV